ncbi:MAG: primosomal protein N' [Ignavibacteriae bacterium]|nr:primosomal protein N' [Ignavibacteriota bacterium]
MSIEIAGTYPAYVNVAIPVAVDKLFAYYVPPELQPSLRRGMRVTVPFGRRKLTGLVVETLAQPPVPNLKTVTDVLDAEPILSDEMLMLTRWIAEYYFAPLGEVLKTVLVPGALKVGKRIIKLLQGNLQVILSELFAAPKQAAIIRELTRESPQTVQQIEKKLELKSISPQLNELSRKGFITIEEETHAIKMKPKLEQFIQRTEEDKSRWQAWLGEVESNKTEKKLAKQVAVVRALLDWKKDEQPSLNQFLKLTRVSSSTLATLKKKNLLTLAKHEVERKHEFESYEAALGAQNVVLNQRQQQALDTIRTEVEKNAFHTFLLHGVTGSGKTQVYIEAIRDVLSRGKTAIVLVPEIALTPQIVQRFRFHFGDRVATMHSRMSHGERYDAWRLTREGKYSIVIGPRSALFAPLKNIGLIVVDEEHEPSFKQYDKTPRYHGRDVAIMRALHSNAVVVLGSATPSFESYNNAVNGRYTLLELPERVDDAKLPPIEIVDMLIERKRKLSEFREQRKAAYQADAVKAKEENKKFESNSISDILKEKIENRLAKKEGIILLQNRRGFAPYIECPDCGFVLICKNCNISLTYHITKKHLRCHYCGSVEQPPDVCPQCDSTEISYRGFGTQRVEQELKSLFAKAKLIRMDLDTTTRIGSHEEMLRKFGEGEADILLGTQMVAKGLDFSRVTLVGVISADTQMLLPDFRSAERTFQLLTQVAGRSGRGVLAGEVVIQTSHPEHECLRHVLLHDFRSFYDEELKSREELSYPPYSRLMLIEFKGKHEELVMNIADAFRAILKKYSHKFAVLGPSPAALPKLKSYFRWHLILKAHKSTDPNGHDVHHAVTSTLHEYRNTSQGKSKSVIISVDVDPTGMM